jgi:NAD(P)-dependent dehydrogenase (short-subunit alcohol dehydrogenase family)
MNLQLEGKLALVTGSTAGIGLAIAKGLAAEGARVVVNGRTEARVSRALESILREHPAARLEGLAADLSRAEETLTAVERYPNLEILINNLGTYEVKPFEQITDADWYALIETNFMSGVRLSRYWLPKMKAAGWGRILFVSSESAVNIPVEMVHYGVTKTMQLALSRGLAEMTSGTGVTVNSILPGPTRSEGVERFIEDVAKSRQITAADFEKEFFRSVRPSSIIQRFATPEEVAALAVFVASPLSSATNGAALHVDGGTVRSIL